MRLAGLEGFATRNKQPLPGKFSDSGVCEIVQFNRLKIICGSSPVGMMGQNGRRPSRETRGCHARKQRPHLVHVRRLGVAVLASQQAEIQWVEYNYLRSDVANSSPQSSQLDGMGQLRELE